MIAAKEKTFSPSSESTFAWSPRGTYVQAAATSKHHQPSTTRSAEQVVSRFTLNDFRARKSQKSPIGSKVKSPLNPPRQNQRSPEKTLGENVVQLRRTHWAIEMSQYRAYFTPGGMDPWGLFLVLDDPDDPVIINPIIINDNDTVADMREKLGGPTTGPLEPLPVTRPNGDPWFDYEPKWTPDNGRGDRTPDWYCTRIGNNRYCFRSHQAMIQWRQDVDTITAAMQHTRNSALFGMLNNWSAPRPQFTPPPALGRATPVRRPRMPDSWDHGMRPPKAPKGPRDYANPGGYDADTITSGNALPWWLQKCVPGGG